MTQAIRTAAASVAFKLIDMFLRKPIDSTPYVLMPLLSLFIWMHNNYYPPQVFFAFMEGI